MAVDNPTAVRFANERVRVAADRMMQAYNFAKTVSSEWFSVEITPGTTLSAGIPNDGGEEVLDGAQSDGRAVISGDDVHNVITRLSELVADLEAGGNAKLNTLAKVSVNPTRGGE